MKNLSIFLNIILIIAVAYLYILNFQNQSKPDAINNEIAASADESRLNYAYINIDTLDANYVMLKDMYEELEKEKTKAERQFKSKMTKFEEDVVDFQKRAQSGLVTQLELQSKQEELGNREAELMKMQQNLEGKLVSLESKRNKELHNSINSFLVDYNTTADLDLIFGYNGMGNVLYADSSLDITTIVLKGLNEKYSADKEIAENE